jgi:hypothetical protein
MPRTTAAPPGRTPRRDFLRLAALAPLAAGCATLPGGPATPAPEGQAPATPGADGGALAVMRAFPLPPEAEPACVFRAEVARGRGG